MNSTFCFCTSFDRYKEAAEILAVNEDRYDHDYVSAFLLEWTVQTMAKQGVEVGFCFGTDYLPAVEESNKMRSYYK